MGEGGKIVGKRLFRVWKAGSPYLDTELYEVNVSEKLGYLSRRTALVAGVLLILGSAGAVYAGIPKVPKQNGSQSGDQGPYGLPGLKKMTDACSLSHDEEQAVLRVYTDYKIGRAS